MRFASGIRLGLLEIRANKFRSFLTMIGIILGVAALVSMMGILEGYFNNIEEWIVADGGLEQVSVLHEDPPEEQEHIKDKSPGRTVLDEAAMRRNCPLVSFVSPEVDMQRRQVHRKGDSVWINRLQGVRADALEIHNYELDRGRMVSDLDNERFAQVAVVGTFVVRELFEPNEPVLGATISIGGIPFTIVGVLRHYHKGYADENWMEWRNKVAFVPLTTMQKRVTGSKGLTQLHAQVTHVDHIDQAVEQIENVLLHTHRGVRDFRVETKQEGVDRWKQIQTAISFAMVGVAAISLVIGGIGITNVMLASINERIREIGIRKAVGARPRDVFTQFIAEAVSISLVGGLLGLGLSALLIQVLKVVLAAAQLVPVLSPRALFIGFTFSVGMGIVSGIYPALRASRLDPIDALRYE
jgi:ABC-type antimicrobial peptide transport system permease subunit